MTPHITYRQQGAGEAAWQCSGRGEGCGPWYWAPAAEVVEQAELHVDRCHDGRATGLALPYRLRQLIVEEAYA